MAKKLSIEDIYEKVCSQIGSLLKKKVESIVGINKKGEEWEVMAEVLERQAVPDTQDILSIYGFKLTSDLDLTGLRRIGLRHRGDLGVEEGYEMEQTAETEGI
jgi:hypothetical protein